MTGKVKWFNAEKGYGFIAADSVKDVFVHYSQVAQRGYKTLDEGQQVEFECIENQKGLQAQHVVKI